MTGTYPDIPGYRFDLSRENVVAFTYSDTAPSYVYRTNAELAAIMDLDPAQAIGTYHSNASGSGYLTILFPEPRTITGIYWQSDRDGNTGSAGGTQALYSTDTTDGYNGTWTTWANSGGRYPNGPLTPLPYYRSAIQALNQANVKAIRLRSYDQTNNGGTQNFRCLHIYGFKPTSGVDRLAFWHPTLDQELGPAYLDFGDLNRGVVSGGRPFRIKNLSATKAATALQVVPASLSGSPVNAPGLQVSNDDVTYNSAGTTAINLAAGATSPVMYARMNLSDTTMTPQARSGRLATIYGSYA